MSTPIAIAAVAALAAAAELSKRGSRSFFPTGMPRGMANGLFMWEPVMTEISSVAPIEYTGSTRRPFDPTSFFLPAQDGQPDRDVWVDEDGNTFVWSEERGKEYVTCKVEWEDLGPGEAPPISASELVYQLEYLTSTQSEYDSEVWWDGQKPPSGPKVFADSDYKTYRYNRFKGWVPHRYELKPVVRLNQAMVGQP